MDCTKEEVSTFLHSVLSCEKKGIPLSRLQEEYTVLIGSPIPYKRFGCDSLEAFIKSIPNAATIRKRSRDMVVEAVVKPSTAHMAHLVAGQKASAKDKPVMRPGRHPAPRQAPSVRFASYQSLLDSRALSPLLAASKATSAGSLASSASPLNLVPASRRPVVQRRHKGIPQLASDFPNCPFNTECPLVKPGGRLEVAPRFQRRTNGVMPPVPNNSVTGIDTAEPAFATAPMSPPPTDLSPSPVAAIHSRPMPTPPVTPPVRTCRELVEEHAERKGLAAAFSALSSRSSKQGPLTWLATLRLDGQTFHSYPEETDTREMAIEEAARKAVEALGLGQGFKDFLPETPVSSPQQVESLVGRIKELVSQKPNGLWSIVIPDMYRDQYREAVPRNWLDLVKSANAVCITEFKDGRCVLEPHSSNSSSNCQPEVRSSDSDTSSTSGTFSEPLPFPDGNYWDVFITNATSTDNVFFRLVDQSESYEQLATDMDSFYAKQTLPVSDLVDSALYATNVEDSWFRVQLLEVYQGKADCYFVDHGDIDAVDISKLQELDPRFMSLPFQAVQCHLDDLLEFADDKQAGELLAELVVGKCLVAEVINREDPITVILYDTTTEKDINLNALLSKHLLTPVFPEAGTFAKARLTHVSLKGDLYVQLAGPSSQTLARYMDSVGSHIKDAQSRPAETLSKSKLYAYKQIPSGTFCRVTVLSEPSSVDTKVHVKCVDLGTELWVAPSSLYDLEVFGEGVARLPHQALVCRLGDVLNGSWTERATHRLTQLVPSDLELLLKVTTPAKDNSPAVVAIFKRIEPNNELVSINVSLAVSLESDSMSKPLYRISTTCSPAVRVRGSASRRQDQLSDFPALLGGLTAPAGRLAGQADSPENRQWRALLPIARCRPWLHSQGKLSTSMVASWLCRAVFAQAFYAAEGSSAFPEGLPEALLRRGQFYAGCHTDKCWYRVLVHQVQEPLMASVYFVDYGDYSMMRPSELQPLWRRFRHLPVQAVPASLDRVAPVQSDWSPVDCLNFRNLVQERQFVARIVAKLPDDKTGVKGAQKLVVRLVDTSTDKDVMLDQLLVQRNIARILE
ncbi:unnamed protein product [Ixodes hexagonus]